MKRVTARCLYLCVFVAGLVFITTMSSKSTQFIARSFRDSCEHAAAGELVADKTYRKDVAEERNGDTNVKNSNFYIKTSDDLLEEYREDTEFSGFLKTIKREKYLPNYFIHGAPAERTDEYRQSHVVFSHFPKSGGTSLKRTMEKVSRSKQISLVLLDERDLGTKIQNFTETMKASEDKTSDRQIIVGGCSFGICERSDRSLCSYMTVIRDPIDRIVSLFFYCQQNTQNDCKGAEKGVSVSDWALMRGSIMFRLLISRPEFCDPLPFRQPNAYQGYSREYAQARTLQETKFPELGTAVRWEELLTKQQRRDLLQYVLDNLENWFTVIGLTEEYELSLQMMQEVYDIPIARAYTGPFNTGSKRAGVGEVTIDSMKAELRQNPLVLEALYEDLSIYERARDIMLKQKSIFFGH